MHSLLRALLAGPIASSLFLSFAAEAKDQPTTVVIRNVTVIDMKADQPQPGLTVVTRGNRIATIGRDAKTPEHAQVIDGTGKFLIPGLWDNYTFTLEAHKNQLPYFDLLVAHGVTGVRDAGTSLGLPAAARLRADIEAGRTLGPRLFFAGPVLLTDLPPRPSNRWTGISTVVTSAEEARKAVATLASAGVNHIKTEKRTPPDILKQIISEAHKHKLPVVGVPPAYIADVSNDDLDCIEHFVEIHRATSNKRDEYYALYRDRTIDNMSMDQNYAFFDTMETDQPYYEEALRTLARNKTFVCTNAALLATFIGDYELADVTRRRFKTKAEIAALEKAIGERDRQKRNADYRGSAKSREKTFRNIADLQKAGVPLLTGTQLSQQSVGTPGAVLHDELQIFVAAG
ncbi:MAG: hypothetical protein H0W20_14235, partial [Chthoniobacterales bacterium]|nr:hypothetical protein [Chthoniobacterales bacterium]